MVKQLVIVAASLTVLMAPMGALAESNTYEYWTLEGVGGSESEWLYLFQWDMTEDDADTFRFGIDYLWGDDDGEVSAGEMNEFFEDLEESREESGPDFRVNGRESEVAGFDSQYDNGCLGEVYSGDDCSIEYEELHLGPQAEKFTISISKSGTSDEPDMVWTVSPGPDFIITGWEDVQGAFLEANAQALRGVWEEGEKWTVHFEADSDNDGIPNDEDECEGHDDNGPDADQDNIVDACDTDRDGDGVRNDEDYYPDDESRTKPTIKDRAKDLPGPGMVPLIVGIAIVVAGVRKK